MNNLLEALQQPLLRLRQACSHPSLGSHGVAHRSHKRKRGDAAAARSILGTPQVATMSEILDRLTEEQQTVAEEELRKVLGEIAGIAAVNRLRAQLISGHGPGAIERDLELFRSEGTRRNEIEQLVEGLPAERWPSPGTVTEHLQAASLRLYEEALAMAEAFRAKDPISLALPNVRCLSGVPVSHRPLAHRCVRWESPPCDEPRHPLSARR